MIIRILVIFLITFTPINATICKKNPTCKCSSKDLDELNIVCDINNSTGYTVNIKSRNNVKIVCKNWKGWDNFYFNDRLSEERVQSLSFEDCGLTNGVRLKDVVKQLGVKDTHTLIFKSFKNLFATLKRKHLQGFPSVQKLILSNNGIHNISKDLLLEFPELEYIDLSNNNFDLPADIFDVTPNLKRIMLINSGMDMIHVGTFDKLKNLESLDIMSNYLTEIKVDTFDKLVSVRSLNLADNKLWNLPMAIFHKLKNLKRLNISMNSFSSIPPKLLDQNKKLEELYLQSNIKKLDTLPDNLLANLTMLSEVHLNNNGFTFLPENLFWGLSSLDYIFLNDNSLCTLPKNIFRGLTKVRKLLLNNNKIVNLPDKIFEDMKELKLLDLSNNLMVRLSSDIFYGLVTLDELNMERNHIKFISKRSFHPLIYLRFAKFSHNPLKLIYISKKLSVFYTNQYLTELYLSNCSISHFFDDWMSGNNNLELLDLSHNFITNVTATSFILPSVEITIDLSYNKIRNFHLDSIEEMVFWRREDRKIDINLKNNPLFCDCPLYHLLRYREGKMYTSVYNYYNIIMGNLKCIQPDEKNVIEISKLNSNTYQCHEHEYFKTKKQCHNDCTCSVRLSDQTRILDCSYKNMSKFLINSTDVIFGRDNPFILNLTGNFLKEIPSTKPLYPINVKALLLSNNNISAITLDKLPKSLKVLELHNNHISYIYFEVLDYLKSISWEKFSLSGNPIICNCMNHNLLKFIQSHRVLYEDLNNLTCKDTHLPVNQISIENLCPSYLFVSMYYLSSSMTIITAAIFIYFMRKYFRSRQIQNRHVINRQIPIVPNHDNALVRRRGN